MILTQYELISIVHAYDYCDNRISWFSEKYSKSIKNLIDDKLIEKAPSSELSYSHTLTDKGKKFVKHYKLFNML